MNIEQLEPPRVFTVGRDASVTIRHAANVVLAHDEQITFLTESGREFDVVRKPWGYYATPSLNKRLVDQGFRSALVRGKRTGRLYVLLVERDRQQEFMDYVAWDGLEVVAFLDEPDALKTLAARGIEGQRR